MAEFGIRTGLRLLGVLLHVGSSPTVRTIKGRLAQLAERILDVYEAVGSSPTPPTDLEFKLAKVDIEFF